MNEPPMMTAASPPMRRNENAEAASWLAGGASLACSDTRASDVFVETAGAIAARIDLDALVADVAQRARDVPAAFFKARDVGARHFDARERTEVAHANGREAAGTQVALGEIDRRRAAAPDRRALRPSRRRHGVAGFCQTGRSSARASARTSALV